MPLPDTIILQYLSQKPQWATSPRILITPLMLSFLWLCLKRSWFLKRRKPLRKIGIIVISQSLKSLLAIRFLWVTYRRYCWYFCIHLSSCLLLFTVGVYSHNYLLLMSFVYTRMCGILENTAPRNTHKSVRASMTWIRIGRKKKNQASEGSFGLVENCDGKIFVWLLSQRWHVERFRKRDLWPYSNQGRWGLWLTPSHPHRPEECCRKHIRWQCGSDPHCSLAIFQPATLSFCKCLFTTIKKNLIGRLLS